MVNKSYNSAKEAFDEIATKVRKVGGDNACEFIANAENVMQGNLDGEKQVLVFSAIRSSDPRYATFRLPTTEKNGPGFNTTSHLIEMGQKLIAGQPETALLYLDKVSEFTKQIVRDKMEPEYQDEIIALIEAESLRMMGIVEEAGTRNENISVFKKEYLYKDKDGSYTSFTGFGEILCQKIYAAYLKAKGLKVGELDPEENSMHIFGNDAGEAMRNEGLKIDKLRYIFARQLKEVFEEKPDVVITGGWEAIMATQRSYTDKKAALIAQALRKLDYEVLYVNEKQERMLSADPAILGSDNGAKPVDRMNYKFLKELTGSRGADTTVLHSDVAEMLESYDIPTVIMNPFGDSKEGTLITRDYLPEENGSDLIASKPVKAALTIRSGNMADQEGVEAMISHYFSDRSIDTTHTTTNTIFYTFDGDISADQCAELQRMLDKKFAAKYKLELRKDLAFVFCLGNNVDAILESAKGTLALRGEQIKPLRLHAVGEESVVSFLVLEKERKESVRILHKALITNHE